MGEEIKHKVASNLVFRFSGIGDWKKTYKEMAKWFNSKKYDFFEKKFKEKSGTAFGKQQEVVWYGEREVTPHIKFTIDAHFWIDGLQNVDVKTPNGEIKKLQKLRMVVHFDANIIQDYSSLEGNNIFSNIKRKILRFLLTKEVDEKYFKMLNDEVHELINILKKGLKTENRYE